MFIEPFIFNWRGQYQNACKIESDLKKIFYKVTVINSDDNNKKDEWVNIGEQAYFAQQFLKAIELFDGDIFFHIQGDIKFEQWNDLISSAEKYFEEYNYGIYAPHVDYTWYNSENADVETIEIKKYRNLKVVSNPDCTVWFIHKDIINILKNMKLDANALKYGWGLDLILCGYAHMNKRLVLRDYNFKIFHPQGTGYEKQDAFTEMNNLIDKCEPSLKQAIQTLRFNKNQLAQYYRSS